jgi:hypothetical protein
LTAERTTQKNSKKGETVCKLKRVKRIVYLLYAKGKMAWRMKLQHLKDITDQFSPGRELGNGGFGVVYKVWSSTFPFERVT